MSGLAALLAGHTGPGLYLWHNAAHVEDVSHAVDHAGWRFAYLDAWTVEDSADFLKAIGVALDLGDEYDATFDSLTAALGDVTPAEREGTVLLWDGWSPMARADEAAFVEALSVLGAHIDGQGRDQGGQGSDQGGQGSDQGGQGARLAVLLRGEGPPTKLPELPDGPY